MYQHTPHAGPNTELHVASVAPVTWYETDRIRTVIEAALHQLPTNHRIRQPVRPSESGTHNEFMAPHDVVSLSRAALQSTLSAVATLDTSTPGRDAALKSLEQCRATEELLDRLTRIPDCGEIRDWYTQAWSAIAGMSLHIAAQLAEQGMQVEPEQIAAAYYARLDRELQDFSSALRGQEHPEPVRMSHMLRTLQTQFFGEQRNLELTKHLIKSMETDDVRNFRVDQLATLSCTKRLSGQEVQSDENADLEAGLLELVRTNYGETDVAEIRRNLMDADWEWSFVTSKPAVGKHREVLMFLGERRLRDTASTNTWRYTGWLNGSKKVLGLSEATVKTLCLSDPDSSQVCCIALPKVATFSIVLSNGGMAYGSETCDIDHKQYCRLAVLNEAEQEHAAGTDLTPELAKRIEKWITETFDTDDARHAKHIYPYPVNGQQVMVQLYHSKREQGDGYLANDFAAAGFPYLTGAMRLGARTLLMAQQTNPMTPERFESWQRVMKSRQAPTVEVAEPHPATPPQTVPAAELSA